MADANRDGNHVPIALGQSSTDATVTLPFKIDSSTGRLLADSASGSGTVTSVSVVTANGFAGTVATETTTPTITLTTTVTGLVKGNGTAFSAASAGTDYVTADSTNTFTNKTYDTAGTGNSFSINGTAISAVTGSGAAVLANSPTFVDDITVGAAGGATGSILFKGTTSGTVTVKSADTAGTWTLTLPDNDGDSGQVLTTNGSGVTSWASAGGVPTTITVADEATDTSCFLGFFTAATGDLGPKTNANLTFNSNTGVATFGQTIVGSISGNAGTASAVAVGGITGLGTGVATALAINVGSAGAFVVFDGALGTPSSGTVTNLTGTASININGTVGATTPSTVVGTTITANTGFMPDANDGAYLGQSGTAFSDLFLASGAVIDFAAGNSVITHSSAVIDVSTGDFQVSTAGTANDSVVTNTGTQTLSNKKVNHTFEPASDDTFTGETLTGMNAGDTVAQWDCIYLASDGKWDRTDADAAATAGGVMVGMAAAASTDTNPVTVIIKGVVRNDGWTWATVGAPLYLDTATAGGMTLTAPSGTDDVIRIVGYVLSDDCIYFNASNDWITHV